MKYFLKTIIKTAIKSATLLLLNPILLFTIPSYGQSSTVNKISTTSPTASALQKFTDYPVSLNTGLIDISIPVYNININGINIPIDFKYHASGIKYDDESEGLGLGWTLNAGGMITQIIQGNQDNPTATDNFFKVSGSINPQPAYVGGDNSSMIALDKGYGDSEYDIYNFTFPGHSGKFFYPGTTTPVTSPLKNLKITRRVGTSTGNGCFDVADESGITYKFGYYSNGSTNPNDFIIERDRMFGRSSNLLLTEIISADKADTVRFLYSGRLQQVKMTIQDKVVLKDATVYSGSAIRAINPHETSQNSYLIPFDYAELLGITFRTGHVTFSYNNTALTGINIYNNITPAPLKVITVQQSAFGNDHFKLDQVNFVDNAQQQTYNYKLAYNGTPPDRRYTGIDYWGYYNGAAYSGDYVPDFQVSLSNNQGIPDVRSVGTMNRMPDELNMLQSGMLQKITYPTGGSSVFTFEAHRYSGGQIAGGLRIQKIDNYDLNGSYLNSKWYKYGPNESGDGTIYKPVDPVDYTYEVEEAYFSGAPYMVDDSASPPLADWICRKRTYGAFPLFNNTWGGGSPVVYDQVTEYGGNGINLIANGKTVYNYENPIDYFAHLGVPAVAYSNSWKAGQLLSKQVYSKNGAAYNLVSSVNNQYDDFNIAQYHNIKVVLTLDLVSNLSENDKWSELENFSLVRPLRTLAGTGRVNPSYSIHNYADYYLLTGSRELISSTEVRDGVSTITNYTYDPTYLKPTTVTTNKSDGNIILTNLTYPFNLTSAPYPAMVNNNIISPVITKSEYKNDTGHPISLLTTSYANWGNLYAPQSVIVQKGTNTAETRLIYDSYDNSGNVLQRHAANGVSETYVWGYNHTYPVAEIMNASYQDVINVLGQPTIDQLNNSPGTDANVRSLLAPLRAAFPQALITTYTYTPLVGMTSMTDPKGQTTYYEYDAFQQLMNIRDKDGNIIKHNEYHYANQ